ncbi:MULTISPECIES: acyl-CoA synthetase [unclassified Gordonia (in: high G+C Gram-positive bacteria)]|uniref:acyl-CoA synthetase n=1 Tax=unclassified Gordonia (in: high G+C Gram-positive bacteria) TaxID=2657482 RepID=UPI00071D432E|nr:MULTISPECIES: acyl-CoA synthetase [unclassified Gordonia (in: high G+C Gram-positive bacteria)]KSU54010.1 acyl-CoA synthetase [Gordonia sp. SGD-V-85]MBR7194028.1 acyl-CoA synthetase [Gordonia sp. SCSIO 19800]SCC54991.1 Acyl-CoA synthetase (AMP-forming)/AMP-acid ligase II [Gordonia sp. v-85]
MAYTIADLIEHAVDLVPERVALESGDRLRSYADLEARANALAHKLRELGVQPGDRVGLYSRNTIESVEAMVAIFKARAVMVNVNYRYVEAELEHIFTDSGMKVLIHERSFAGRVCNTLPKAPDLEYRVVIEDGSDEDLCCAGHSDAICFEEAIAVSSTERDFEERSDDDLYMLYTGGTTGKPKGVVWRQEDVWRVLGGGIDWYTSEPVPDEWHLAKTGAEGGQLVRYPIPPFIHGGSQWAIFQSLFAGGKAVVYPEFSGSSAWDIVERHKVNVVFITGDAMGRPMIEALESGGDRDLSSVLSIASSACLFSPSVKEQFLDRFPNSVIIDAIGSSETGFGGMGVVAKDTPHTGGPRVKADKETHVLREDGTPVEPGSGEVGVLARSGHVPLRYHNDPEKSAKTFKVFDGVRYSLPGDNAVLEADGTITMLGRGSVSINTGGEKVFPEEVEGALKAHPDVFDTVVVGVADDRWGQRVAAVIATRDGARPSLTSLNDVVRKELAGYKCPRSVWFVDEIKRSPAGKPDYRWGASVTTERPADEAQ